MKFFHKIFFLILISFSLVYAEDLLLKVSGNPYFTEDILNNAVSGSPAGSLEKTVNSILDFYTEKGFPLVTVTIDSVRENDKSTTLFVSIESGDYVRIGRTVFSGAKVTKQDVLFKQSRLSTGMKFSEETVSNASYRLYKSGLFTKRPEWEIFKDVSGYGLNYKISEKKYNELLFLGGYSSSGTENDYSVLAQIKLGNIFGSMRRAAVLWDRSGGAYEKLRLSYREPFILSFPLSTEIEFSQAYRKDLSLTRRLKAAQSYELDLNYSLNYGWSGEKVYPDSLYSGRPNEVITKKYYAGMEYSTILDRKPIPEYSGWRMHGLLSSVEINIKDSTDSNGLEAFSEIELIHALRENIILNAKLSYNQVFFKNDIPDFNRIDFGGALSFRGYREDFFASDIYLKQSADLFFVTGTKDIAFNVFSDFCQYNEGEGNIQKPSGLTFLRSYGGGIIYESGFGQMQILLGIPEKEGFIQSVVHVKYSVRF